MKKETDENPISFNIHEYSIFILRLSDGIMINRIEINLNAPPFASLNTYVCNGNVSIYIKDYWIKIHTLNIQYKSIPLIIQNYYVLLHWYFSCWPKKVTCILRIF